KVGVERTPTALGKPGRHRLPAHAASHAGGGETGRKLVDDGARDRLGMRQSPGGAVPKHLGFGIPEVGEIGEGMECWSDKRPAVFSLHRSYSRVPARRITCDAPPGTAGRRRRPRQPGRPRPDRSYGPAVSVGLPTHKRLVSCPCGTYAASWP